MAWTATLESVQGTHDSIIVSVMYKSPVAGGKYNFQETHSYGPSATIAKIKQDIVNKLVVLESVEDTTTGLKQHVGLIIDSSGNPVNHV